MRAAAAGVQVAPAAPSAARGSVLVGTAGTAGLNIATTALNFVLALVLARALGSAGYGAYAYAFAWATFLSVPATLGLTPLVIRYVSAYVVEGRWGLVRGVIVRTNQVVIGSSLLLMAVGAGVGWLVHGSDNAVRNPLLIGLLLVPLLSLTSLRQAAMKGFNHVVLGRVPETIVVPGLSLLLVGGVWWARGRHLTAEWAIGLTLVAVLVAFLLGTVILSIILPADVRQTKAEHELRSWVRSGVPLLAIGLLLVVVSQVGTILLGAIDNAASAGIFSIAVKVSAFTSFFYLAASYPLYPTVARLWASGETDAIERLLTRTSRLVLVGAVGTGAIFVVFGHRILDVFGAAYADQGLTALRILVLAEIVKVAAGYGGLALIMTPFERSMMLGTGLGVALNVPLTAALIPVWGVNGAAAGSAVGGIVSALAFVWLSRKRLGIYGWALGGSPPRTSST